MLFVAALRREKGKFIIIMCVRFTYVQYLVRMYVRVLDSFGQKHGAAPWFRPNKGARTTGADVVRNKIDKNKIIPLFG